LLALHSLLIFHGENPPPHFTINLPTKGAPDPGSFHGESCSPMTETWGCVDPLSSSIDARTSASETNGRGIIYARHNHRTRPFQSKSFIRQRRSALHAVFPTASRSTDFFSTEIPHSALIARPPLLFSC
jgi:hypothetical protein